VGEPAEYSLGYRPRRDKKTRARTKIAELLADEQCSKATLDFLATTNAGRRQAHRWQRREEEQAVRPRRENAKSTSHRWRLGREEFVFFCLGSSYFFFFLLVSQAGSG